jgi:hypothetical protein
MARRAASARSLRSGVPSGRRGKKIKREDVDVGCLFSFKRIFVALPRIKKTPTPHKSSRVVRSTRSNPETGPCRRRRRHSPRRLRGFHHHHRHRHRHQHLRRRRRRISSAARPRRRRFHHPHPQRRHPGPPPPPRLEWASVRSSPATLPFAAPRNDRRRGALCVKACSFTDIKERHV